MINIYFYSNWFRSWIYDTEKDTEVIYQCDNEYSMSSEGMIKWNDADIGINWPNIASKISER